MTRLLAFYLPQFHTIPENDAWWGPGFTEWDNVRRGRPLFPGHLQPKLPAGDNFYDLRRPESLREQAGQAKKYGLDGFVFYHYWFKGQRLLHRPLDNLLAASDIDLPFCLCWANESWSRRWDGLDHDLLIKQEYSPRDDENHIRALLPVFADRRYIRVNGCPLLLIYRSENLPEPQRTAVLWRRMVAEAGLPGLFLLRVESLVQDLDPALHGCDGAVEFAPDWRSLQKRVYPAVGGRWALEPRPGYPGGRANRIYLYAEVVAAMQAKSAPGYRRFPGVFPGWDNSSRRRLGGATIIHGATPARYQDFLASALRRVKTLPVEERLVFINAWNEWGEGCCLEADKTHGRAFLKATAAARCKNVDNALNIRAGTRPLERPVERPFERKDKDLPQLSAPPLVSVIIPAYNHERWIDSTLASLRAQTFSDFEVLVVDDGSTDATADRVAAFADPRISLLRQQNQGTAAALNRGLSLARGKYVALLNSDDLYTPERLAELVAALEANPAYELGFSRVSLIDDQGRELTQGKATGWLHRAEADFAAGRDLLLSILRDNFLCTSSNFFFRRRLLLVCGGFQSLRYVNDLDFLLRTLPGRGFYLSERRLLAYRQHESNTLKEKESGHQADFLLEISWVLARALRNPAFAGRWELLDLARLLAGYFEINLETLLFAYLYLERQPKIRAQRSALSDLMQERLREQLARDRYREELAGQVISQKQYIKEQLGIIAKLEEGQSFFQDLSARYESEHRKQKELLKLKETEFNRKESELNSQLAASNKELIRERRERHEIWQSREWFRTQNEALLNSRRFLLFDHLQALKRGENPLFQLRALLRLLLPERVVGRLRSWRHGPDPRPLSAILSRCRQGFTRLRRVLARWRPPRSGRQTTHDGPLVSVILPCYNHGAFLPAVEACLQAQTFRDFEVIFIDDGSTEPLTRERVAAYRQQPPAGWRIMTQENQGVIGARNRAISEARGRYIFPLDTDDTIAPTFLEKTVFLLEHLPPHYFAYSWTNVVGADPYVWVTENSDPLKIVSENRIGAAIFPRQAWIEVGGYNEIMREGYEDWEFYVNLVRHGYVGRVIPEALYNYLMVDGSRNDGAGARAALLKRRIRDLHLGNLANHASALRRRARQRWRLREDLVNLIKPGVQRPVAGLLDLRREDFNPLELLPRLAAFLEASDQPLILLAYPARRAFFALNRWPGLQVYYPGNYAVDGDPRAFVDYLGKGYRLTGISPKKLTTDLVNLSGGKRQPGAPLRILYAAPWVITGGADTMLVDWFRELDDSWCEKFLLTTLPRRNVWLGKLAGQAREIYDLPDLGAREQAEIEAFLLDLIALRRIDILHIMNSEAAFKALPTIKKRYPELKVVAQFHCFDHLPDGRRVGYALDVPRLYDKYIDSYNIEYGRLRDELQELYPFLPAAKFRVIHGRVDGRLFAPGRRPAAAAIAARRCPERLNLLFIGRLDRQKQPLRLVEMARILKERRVPFVLHVVGDGNLESQKKTMQARVRECSLEDEVIFHGEQPLGAMYDWYRVADVMLLTSDWEGVPMVLYQAMAMEVVPVVAEVGGCGELVDQSCGFLVAEREWPEAYAEAVISLQASDLRRRLAAAGRARMLARFSLEELDADYRRYYQDLLK